MGGKTEMGKGNGWMKAVALGGLRAPSFLFGLNRFRECGGLGEEARAGRFLAPGGDDRAHLGTALLHGLRKRSAGAAVEMLVSQGHRSSEMKE
jgi:hypothetical protein